MSTAATLRIAIRGFADGELKFCERHEIAANQIDAYLPAIATKHAEALRTDRLHMVEIEFEDEPNENERFFRLGTDPRGMVAPIAIATGARPC